MNARAGQILCVPTINLINNFFQIKNYLKIKSKNNINIKSKLKESKIVIEGLNNLIKIEKSNLKRLKIGIYGKNNILEKLLMIIIVCLIKKRK